MKKLYFLGPNGTYSESAALKVQKLLKEDVEIIPVSTIAKIVELVNNSNNIAVLPIENSIEGIVRPSVDNIYLSDTLIQAQIDIKIEHCLISKGKKEDIKHIVSHPQALAQCQKYITFNFDDKIELIESTSTAKAFEIIKDKDVSWSAVVSSDLAHKTGFNIIDKNIGDIKDNKTRFVLISKNELNTGKKARTSIVFNTKNESGALLEILLIINKYKLNLVYIESRPSKKVFGEYNFFVDVDRGIDEIQDALSEIQEKCNYYKMIGSYPIFGN